jgi:hypothetical protein
MEADNQEILKTNITEPIINKDITGGSFEIGILNKKGKLEPSKMTFDKNQKIILLSTKQGVEIKIHYDDVISFTKDQLIKVKTILEENTELNNSKSLINLDMRIFDLYYFPKFKYKSCSFFGVFVCKPTETVKRRALKVKLNNLYELEFKISH